MITMEKKDLEELLTIEELAAKLKISEGYIYKLMKKGELKATKIGKATRFTQKEVQSFIERHTSK